MHLYLMRHGEASHQAPSDAQRPLTPRGQVDAGRCARLLQQLQVHPVAIFASPRLRAQQTAGIIAEVLEQDVTTANQLDFEFDVDKLSQLLMSLANVDESSVICVGHNPTMSSVVQHLSRARVSLPAGGIACLEATMPEFKFVALRWLLTPDVLAACAATP